jgi:predicted DNA-binding transcriptional regulator YafY
MRASRLVALLGLLQGKGQLTAAQLAAALEVSQRTVLRDIEALSSAGIPVYAVRGKHGGFQLIDGFASSLPGVSFVGATPPGGTGPGGTGPGGTPRARQGRTRARIRLSPRGRRLALLTGRPPGLRIRRSGAADPPGWTQAWIPVDSAEATIADLLALGVDAELLSPPDLREQLRQAALRIAALHEVRPEAPPSALSGE